MQMKVIYAAAVFLFCIAGCDAGNQRPYGYGYGSSPQYYAPQYQPAPRYYPPPAYYPPPQQPPAAWREPAESPHQEYCENHPRKCQHPDND